MKLEKRVVDELKERVWSVVSCVGEESLRMHKILFGERSLVCMVFHASRSAGAMYDDLAHADWSEIRMAVEDVLRRRGVK